jgi:O-antigen/teichoic acid export membrane protein
MLLFEWKKVLGQVLRSEATLYSFIGAISTAISQIIQIILLGKYLNQNSFAAFTVITIVVNVGIVVVEYGVGNHVLRLSAIDSKGLKKIFSCNLINFLVFSILLVFGFFWFKDKTTFVSLWLECGIISIVVCLNAINRIQIGILQRFQNFRFLAIGEVVGASVLIILNIAFCSILESEYSPFLAAIGSTLAKAGVWFSIFNRLVLQERIAEGSNESYLWSGFLQTIERLFDIFCGNIDKILIVKLIGMNQMGLYAFAASIALAPKQLIGTIFNRTTLAEIVLKRSEPSEAKEVYVGLLRKSALAFGLNYILISWFGPSLLEHIFEGKWSGVYSVLPIFCIYGFWSGISSTIGILTISFNRFGLSLTQKVVENILVLSCVNLLSQFGLIGVVLSYIIVVLFLSFTVERYISSVTVRFTYSNYLCFFAVWMLPCMLVIFLPTAVRLLSSAVVFQK